MKRKHLVPVLGVVVVAAVAYTTHGMWGRKGIEPLALDKPPSATPVANLVVRTAEKGFDVPYEPLNVKASVAPYTVKADLSNIVNRTDFGEFTAEHKALLAKNAFFARPTNEQQLFFIYEQNDYQNVPSFITADSVLQVYHIFYDFTLRSVETSKLYGVLDELTGSMVKSSNAVAGQLTDPEWKKAAADNQVYFAIPASLLGQKVKLPSAGQQKVLAKELDLIAKAPGRVDSALFPWQPDYSQFIPRGHYTRSDQLKKFFRSMMWYGFMSFPVIWPVHGANHHTGDFVGDPAWHQIRQALLITKMLYDTEIDGRPAIEAWDRIYAPTAFYVGKADDLTPMQYKAVMDKIYGKNATYAQLQDHKKLRQVFDELMKLPYPKIDVRLFDVRPGKGKMPLGRQFKFMGQRYIADSEILQKLSAYPERPFPRGLDVMAVLGSDRAVDILDNIYDEPSHWNDYVPKRTDLRRQFDETPGETWRSNLYWGWLWTLDSLLDPFGKGYPSFMTTVAWQDKSLNSALGSWAELRHDTILYGKQSGIECGGNGEEPPLPKGYVEPNVEFYNRLIWLTRASRSGLQTRDLITPEIAQKFRDFEDLLTFLLDISVKELTGAKVTREEYDRIKIYGADLERLTLSVMEGDPSRWYEITSETDKNMAVIADVHTSGENCLEEGVGYANEIFVVVPIEGKLYLTRGAIFSYYEFVHPSADRLTDEKWQEMLKTKRAPAPPDWIKSFMPGDTREEALPREVYESGC